jgi:hypothetical protein
MTNGSTDNRVINGTEFVPSFIRIIHIFRLFIQFYWQIKMYRITKSFSKKLRGFSLIVIFWGSALFHCFLLWLPSESCPRRIAGCKLGLHVRRWHRLICGPTGLLVPWRPVLSWYLQSSPQSMPLSVPPGGCGHACAAYFQQQPPGEHCYNWWICPRFEPLAYLPLWSWHPWRGGGDKVLPPQLCNLSGHFFWSFSGPLSNSIRWFGQRTGQGADHLLIVSRTP